MTEDIVADDSSEVSRLTEQQRLAIGTRTARLFIEAGPGTGKTTVSAIRFGVHRFQPAPPRLARRRRR